MPPNFCGQCGERTTSDQRFCERCGKPLVEETAQPEIPTTRFGMKKPVVMPTIAMPPSQPGMAPGATPQPWAPAPVDEAPRRRRRWPWVVLGLLAVFAASAVGGWFAAPVITHGLAARIGLPTGDGEAEVMGWPIDEDGEQPRFDIQLASLPSSPPGHTLATPVFTIEPRDEVEGPFEIALPLFDSNDERVAVVGHYHDGAWEPLPTEVFEGRLIAVTDSFSHFAGWYPDEEGRRSAYDASRLIVAAPKVLYGEVSEEGPAILFDLRGLSFARDRAWGRYVPVEALHVEVNQPEGDLSGPRPGRFEPYSFDGEPVRWSPREGVGRLPISRVPISRIYDHLTPLRHRRWQVRVVPVFADGSSGPPSDLVDVYADPLRAFAAMNRELPLDASLRAAFDARVAAHPLRVVYGGYPLLRDAYNGSLGWSRRRGWGRAFGGVAGPHIGVTLDATYGNVLTHEWGHYAAHMALGDDYENDSPGGAHNGWVESSRALAFTEDLATLLGQWSTGVGVPSVAGAMFGRTRAMSRTPEGNGGPYWPADRDLDAAAVETVPATVMSRLAHEIGFESVFATIVADTPRDLIAFVEACGPTRREVLQPILLDEGVSWVVQGRVVQVSTDGSPPTPVEGATVRVRTLDGVELVAPAADRSVVRPISDAAGRFTVRVPPGEVSLVAEKPGLSQRARVTFSAHAASRTNAEPQRLGSDLEMEQGLELVIESPLEGATVSERIQVVRGRVERRDEDVIETVTLTTAGGEVQVPLQGDSFEGRVTLTPGDNTITASAQSGEAVASASVTVNAEIAATVLMCELTWNRNGTDVDLWVTDPDDVTTGFRNRHPREGRLLDVDNTRGYGPETFTMSADVPGAYQVRINYYGGRDPVGFRVRWCVREATPQAQCGEETGTLTESDHNAGRAAGANHRFTVQVPARR